MVKKLCHIFLAVAVSLVVLCGIPAAAIETDSSRTAYRNPLCATALAATAAGSVYTSDEAQANANQIYQFLTTELHLNRAAACGVLANIYAESDFDPMAGGDAGTSHGICQWHKSRWATLVAWCQENGYQEYSLEGQLQYLKYELSANKISVLWNGKTIYKKMLAIEDTEAGAYEAGRYWCVAYEVPANKETVSVTRGDVAKETYRSGVSQVSEDTTSVTIRQAKQPMTVTKKNKTVKYSKVRKKKQVVSGALKVSKAKGKVTYQKVSSGSSKYLSVSKKTGKITVKKGTKKGIYKIRIRVKAAGDQNYKAGSKVVTVKIRVK